MIAHAQRVRCAIYTRKSSEEGLEQGFNSLDAQREACAAYVLSQAHEGWTLLPVLYDDGGISGGTLERPALKRLMADIAAGLIDTVVVYKVDRLSRSLFDFAKLVEAFEAKGTSFISITQSFNTTTSMGRLTLNMLLSFAQFEREVTAERIRDKIAASKARGMWMGGVPPLGYAPDGRTLRIVDEHAAFVRAVFQRYLACGTVRNLAEQLDRDGLHAPVRTTATGRTIGARPLSRGQLYLMLKCRTYLGEVQHREQVYPGLHLPIIERELWDQVQAQLAASVQGRCMRVRAAQPSLLAGKLTDQAGEPLVAVHANKGKVRYRYYVSRDLHHGHSQQGMRIPAREIEQAVCQRLAALFDDPLALAAVAGLIVAPHDLPAYQDRCSALAAPVRGRTPQPIDALVTSVCIHDGRIELMVDLAQLAQALALPREPDLPTTLVLVCEVRLTRSGRAMRLVQGDGAVLAARPDGSLAKLLAKARAWWVELRTGELDVQTLAARERVSASYVTRVLRLAFLAPAVFDAALAGKLRAEVNAAALTAPDAIPASWREQRQAMLPGGA